MSYRERLKNDIKTIWHDIRADLSLLLALVVELLTGHTPGNDEDI